MSDIGVGVIGLGSIGLRMLAAMEEHPRFTVRAVWDPASESIARAVSRHRDLPVATDPAALVTSPEVEVVYIACPPAHHAAHVLAARDVGKPVLCEKPLGVDLAASRELVAGMAPGAPCGINFLLAAARSADWLMDAKASGALGAVRHVEIRLHLPGWAAHRHAEAPWLAQRAQGGFLREVGSHFIYFLRRLLGDVRLETATVDRIDDGVSAEHHACLALRAGGVPAVLHGATAGTGADVKHCIVRADGASYRIRDFHWLDVEIDEGWRAAFEPPAHPERDTHLRQLDRVARLLDGDAHALASFTDALAVQEIVEAALSR